MVDIGSWSDCVACVWMCICAIMEFCVWMCICALEPV